MVNRLYETRGWTKAWWQGNGGGLSGLIYYLPTGWGYAKQNQGAISYVHPGDVITFNYGTDGHAGIINSIDSLGTLHIINQNTTNPSDVNSTATLNSGTSLSSGNAAYTSSWSGYSVQAIVHHPNTTPTAVARDSNDMDAFYNDGQGDVVDRSWNGTSWSVSHTWSDGGGVMSQPAVVSRSSGNLDVFYTTDQNKLVTYHWTSGGGWTGPTALLTSGVAGDPSVIARNSTDMQVFYRDTAGDVKAIHWTGSSVGDSGTWNTNPQNLYSSNATTDPGSTTRSSDSMEVFFGKNNGNIVHLGWSSAYGWVTQDFGANNGVAGKPSAIQRNGGGDMSAYFEEQGSSGTNKVGEEAWDWINGWSGQDWSASLAGNPSAFAGLSNVVDDFYRETGGNVVDRYFNGSSWQTTNIASSGNATSDPNAIIRDTSNEEVFYWNGFHLMDNNWNTTSQSWNGGAQIN